jgi:VWFA-related protein
MDYDAVGPSEEVRSYLDMRNFCRLALLLTLLDPQPIDPLVPPIRIDAVIGDVRWMPIPGLRASDIEVVEDGIPRKVESAELRGVPRRTTADTSPIQTAADEERAVREPGARTFIFLLDEFHISPGLSAERARLWMADFIDAKVYERDLAIVVRPLDSVRSLQLTRDHSELHGVVAGFSGRKGQYEPRTPLEERAVGRDPSVVPAARRRIVVEQLNDVARRLADLKADRPVVVIVSEGFPTSERDLEPFLRASSAFHFIVYTINPALASEDVAGPVERDGARAMRQRLAIASGGLAVEADAIIYGFARVAHDSESYWVLTYRPLRADGGLHSIEVRTKIRDAQIRAPSGYWANPASEWRAPPSSSLTVETIPRRRLRRTSVVDAWVGVRSGSGDGAHMVIAWEPRTIGGREPRAVAIKARSVEGRMLFDDTIARVGSQVGAEKDHARFSVPSGRIELDLTVLAGDGSVIDTDARDVDVPNLRALPEPGPVLLTPEIVRARNHRELEKAIAGSGTTPAALRTFARGDSLLIRVPTFDATGAAVRVTARLLNQAGVPIRSVEAVGGAAIPGVTQFALPLHWLPSGLYVIELVGTDGTVVVSERLAFRVTG